MIKLLKQISEKAIELADVEFSEEQHTNKWLGTEPVSENDIQLTEKRLGVELPADFKLFLSITNGFSAPTAIEPTFESIKNIDFLKTIDPFIIEAYSIEGIEDIGKQLERSILIGGRNEEQYFLLIPPTSITKKWSYWKFANWHPGEEEYVDLENYFKEVLSSMTTIEL